MRKARWKLAVMGLLLLGVLDYVAFPSLARPAPRVSKNRENALWLKYDWYFGKQTDFSGLAQRLERGAMRDAYFHVRSVKADGTLKYRFAKEAQRLNREMALRSPKVRRLAWIYAGNSQGFGKVMLGDAKVRAAMVREARWLVEVGGFSGVQWDYEICPDGDPNLLRLLDETRAALPKGAFLSVAVPTWYPPPLGSVGWSEAYFREVAKRSDQMAVMAYDSAMLTPRLYTWWLSEQVVRTCRAAVGTGCRIVMGLATYEDGTLSHNPHAEKLRNGLLGVRKGLAAGVPGAWQGVGLFADYTTDAAEWETFERDWLRTSHKRDIYLLLM